MHDDQDGQEYCVNSQGKRGRIFEITERAIRPIKTRKCPSNNASLLLRGANAPTNISKDHNGQPPIQACQTELGTKIRPESDPVPLPQSIRNELCNICQEIDLSRFNIEKHVSGTDQSQDQNELA